MNLINALNHAAIVTADLDRFIDFYTQVFELEVVFREATPSMRHAILRLGPQSWLHPVEVAGNTHATAKAMMLDRGHLDHVALNAVTSDTFAEVRRRLSDRDAVRGEVKDMGAFHSIWFEDPDGMRGEVIWIIDHALRGIHEPRSITTEGSHHA
jgi:catechol 2,3-dioxygenase-like lactoylglutathione lyase family enzyme